MAVHVVHVGGSLMLTTATSPKKSEKPPRRNMALLVKEDGFQGMEFRNLSVPWEKKYLFAYGRICLFHVDLGL